MRTRLGIDLDGVVVDFSGGWVTRYNAEFGTNIAASDVVTWGAPRDLTHFPSMSKFWSWASTCGDGRSLFHVLDPYPGALAGLDSLVERGHDLVIVTTKPNFAIEDTHEWLIRHGVPAVEVHIVDDKAKVSCDLYVDDAMHNLESYRKRRPEAAVVRWVQPWNEALDGVLDATTWDEIGDFARGIDLV
jgi:5'(3')-deoxyribonucleotidase